MELQRKPVDLSRIIFGEPATPIEKPSSIIYLLNLVVCCFVFYTFSPYYKVYQCKNLVDALLFYGSILCAVCVGILDMFLYCRSTFGKFVVLSTSAIIADIVIIVVDGSLLTGSHNMAPFELIAFSLSSFVLFSLLFLVSKIFIYIIGD